MDKKSFISVGFCDLLTLTFIILKLCNVINWGWWWVLAPTWISITIGVILLLIAERIKK